MREGTGPPGGLRATLLCPGPPRRFAPSATPTMCAIRESTPSCRSSMPWQRVVLTARQTFRSRRQECMSPSSSGAGTLPPDATQARARPASSSSAPRRRRTAGSEPCRNSALPSLSSRRCLAACRTTAPTCAAKVVRMASVRVEVESTAALLPAANRCRWSTCASTSRRCAACENRSRYASGSSMFCSAPLPPPLSTMAGEKPSPTPAPAPAPAPPGLPRRRRCS